MNTLVYLFVGEGRNFVTTLSKSQKIIKKSSAEDSRKTIQVTENRFSSVT